MLVKLNVIVAAAAALCAGAACAQDLVVRIGHTTIDSVTRAMQSLCNNNVVGIVVNGARRGELYSKYTYYHSYYTPKEGYTPRQSHDAEGDEDDESPSAIEPPDKES